MNLNSITLTFPNDKSYEKPLQISMLQDLICEHFNLILNEVIYEQRTPNDVIFRIHLHPDKEFKIVICDEFTAMANTKEMNDTEEIKSYLSNSQIGIYKKLGNSFYYFRWLDDLE